MNVLLILLKNVTALKPGKAEPSALTDFGKASRVLCWLKSRVLLYAASPLFNGVQLRRFQHSKRINGVIRL